MKNSLNISYNPPFDWSSLLEFLRVRATPGVESVEQDAYMRTAIIDGAIGTVMVTDEPGRQRLRVQFDGSLAEKSGAIKQRVAHLLDLEVDIDAVARKLKKSSTLRAVVTRHPGLRVPGAWDPFELAVRAIVGQQVTVKAATTLMGRIAERAGTVLSGREGGVRRLFPSPAQIVESDLSNIGAPSSRIGTVTRLAEAVAAGAVCFSGSDPDSLSDQLTRIKGIGRWTAGYIAMRTLRGGDAYPYGDLVLRKAVSNGGALISPSDLDRIFDEWRPWRAYAALYLWKRWSATQRNTDVLA